MRRRDFVAVAGGTIITFTLPVKAEAPQMSVVGFLGSGTSDALPPIMAALRDGLRQQGFDEGRNVVFEFAMAEGNYERIPDLAREFVRKNVKVIVTQAPPATLAARRTTSTIPIVFAMGADPVNFGLVESLNRPGGNVTGVMILLADLGAKRLELLRELMPEARLVAVLINPDNPNSVPEVKMLEAAAAERGWKVLFLQARNDREIDDAYAAMVEKGAQALLVGTDTFFFTRHARFISLALNNAIPAIFDRREFIEAGGLMSYGASIRETWRHAGEYVGRILNGATPSELPVLQPTKIDFTLNLATARKLGLAIPPTLLARADEVIE